MKSSHARFLLVLVLISLLLVSCASGQPAAPDAGTPPTVAEAAPPVQSPIRFDGEIGQEVALKGGEIRLDASVFADSQARYYHTRLSNGKTVYFFVVKDRNGIYRAAANACQVCYEAGRGFRQEGDLMICNACGNRYPLTRVATEKGGCNPGPISPNLIVNQGQLVIQASSLAEIAELF